MAAKPFREQIRVDMLTSELVFALINKLSPDDPDAKQIKKSEIYRMAVYRMAKDELTDAEFQEVFQAAMDMDRM